MGHNYIVAEDYQVANRKIVWKLMVQMNLKVKRRN